MADLSDEKDSRSRIQAEQLKLLKTEKKLKELLSKINENLNLLTVEELQLKSNAIRADFHPKIEKPMESFKEEYQVDDTEEVNKQNLFLDVFGNPMSQQQEYDSS